MRLKRIESRILNSLLHRCRRRGLKRKRKIWVDCCRRHTARKYGCLSWSLLGKKIKPPRTMWWSGHEVWIFAAIRERNGNKKEMGVDRLMMFLRRYQNWAHFLFFLHNFSNFLLLCSCHSQVQPKATCPLSPQFSCLLSITSPAKSHSPSNRILQKCSYFFSAS